MSVARLTATQLQVSVGSPESQDLTVRLVEGRNFSFRNPHSRSTIRAFSVPKTVTRPSADAEPLLVSGPC